MGTAGITQWLASATARAQPEPQRGHDHPDPLSSVPLSAFQGLLYRICAGPLAAGVSGAGQLWPLCGVPASNLAAALRLFPLLLRTVHGHLVCRLHGGGRLSQSTYSSASALCRASRT